MSVDLVVTVGLVIAVVLAAVDLVRVQFQSLTSWACVVGFGVLLIGHLA